MSIKEVFNNLKNYKKWMVVAGGIIVIVACIIGFNIYENSLIYKVCHVEAGIDVTVTDFLKVVDEEAVFTEDSDKIDVTVPGEYHLKIKTGPFAHACTLYVEDTTMPVVEAKDVIVQYGGSCDASEFISKLEDVTKTNVVFKETPDFQTIGQQEVEIVITDAGNNEVTVNANLTVWPIVPSLVLEAGAKTPTVDDFIIVDVEAKLVTNLKKIDYSKPATHKVVVEVEGKEYNSEIVIRDTVAPELTLKNINGYVPVPYKAKDFVKECKDATKVKYTFEEEPDYTKVGTQTVTIVATDEGKNKTKETAELVLKEDSEAPRIKGVRDLTAYIGEGVSYKSGITLSDNSGVEPKLSIDSSKVNASKEGKYEVVYTVTDLAGNSTSETVTITVKKRVYSLKELNAKVDKILKKILKKGMTNREKAKAIFTYIRTHIRYVDSSDKGNYVKAAYEGLVKGRGDCYVYASVTKVFLTRAGFPNMDIERIPKGNELHYWNLIDIGDGHGWYHFDTTPRKDGTVFFLWDDKAIKKYSDANYGSHNYDRSLYPKIK